MRQVPSSSQWLNFYLCEACESISSMLRCLRLLRNCAPALSIIQNGAVGRALPELFHHPRWSLSMTTTGRWGTPAASTAPASTSLRCGSGRWCSRPPLLQFRLGWSLFQQSNLDLPHGKGRGRKGREDRKEGMRTTRNGCGSLESFSFSEGWWSDAEELQGVRGSQSRRTDLFTGMHRWACFCNTKALLLVSPSPSTWSALHPNAPRAEKPARRWLGSIERLEYRERPRKREREGEKAAFERQ